ncbi:MAG: protein phosphatase [Deltaproteobacteria bacterium 13_1_20CM_2_69_21]|nr:MAG: protein phosphatase [Deltaproteobacteria bacterium 13_1_40CM_4_68_19]OLD08108.1 MAG: protein phosphatase [Deltaproteobacteria bacterium 13_1_40CM_3_69_14]OLD47388.1 MAG: protein phosphatase [Chloroflexi bacterium 13_1_40CM_2_68_14]OLE62500.1 MAG: protein phosphatase [Deltaproteobacteria bacterium 13_1_20CM_2_69_21]
MPKFRSAARTDVGMKRDHNEDSFLVNEDIGLYVVCDGMGGHAGGETASRLAVQTIEKELISAKLRIDDPFSAKASLPESPLAGALREAVEGACAAVFRSSRAHPELAGMGTTCISLLVQGDHAIVGHVGDSRAYLVRDGQVWQLSEDHSLVNEQVRAGLLTEEEAKHSRLKNIITRSVGFEEDVLVDVVGVETRSGDKFLLCSDGLSNLIDNDEIRDALVQTELDQVPEMLIQLANSRGGDDNITVIAVHREE